MFTYLGIGIIISKPNLSKWYLPSLTENLRKECSEDLCSMQWVPMEAFYLFYHMM